MTRNQNQRSGYHDVSVGPPQGGMTLGSLLREPLFGMALTGLVIAIGFYYSTNATMTNLKESQTSQDKKFEMLVADSKAARENQDKKAELQAAEQKAAREKLAETWQRNQEKNTEVLGLLVTRLTVSEKAQERSDGILNRVVDQLQQFNSGRSTGTVTQPPR